MSYFNLNNFSLLAKLGHEGKDVSILLDKNELCIIANGIVKETGGRELKDIFKTLLSSRNDMVVVPKGDTPSDSDPERKNISFSLADHMASIELSSFDHLIPDTISLKMNSRLNFNEYAHYLKHTDVFVSPILYQWISTRFERNEDELIPYMEMDGSLRHLSSDPRLLLQTLFVLASMGSMEIISDAHTSAADEPAVKPETAPVKSYTPILTKLGLGGFISGALDNRAGILTINSDEGVSSIDLNDIALSVDNIQTLKINNFLLKLFLANKYLETRMTGETSPETISLARFRLFEQTKKLPLQLFETSFAQDTVCLFSLTEPNYIIKAALYRSAGMDIADFSILSMLRIKESTPAKLMTRLSNYTTHEISRSLFGLLILGLITVSEQDVTAKSYVLHGSRAVDPELEQHKDILKRIAQKLVSL